MNAWERLKTASALAVGTAWQLLSNPRTGSGSVIRDGYTVHVADSPFAVGLVVDPLAVSVAELGVEALLMPREPISVAAGSAPVQVLLNDGAASAEVH